MKDFNGVLRNRSQCMVGGCIDRFVKKFGEQCLSQEIQGALVSALSVSLCSVLSLTISMTLTLFFKSLCVCTCMRAHTGMHSCACSLAHLWRSANIFRYVFILTFDIEIFCCPQLHAPDWLAGRFLGILMSTPSLSFQNIWEDCYRHFQSIAQVLEIQIHVLMPVYHDQIPRLPGVVKTIAFTTVGSFFFLDYLFT